MSGIFAEKLAALENETITPAEFSHKDHIGVAYEAIQKYGPFDAMSIIARGIKALTVRAGLPEKFNATITLASMLEC